MVLVDDGSRDYFFLLEHVLSWEEAKVPVEQPAIQFPSNRKNPGKQPVHSNKSIVDAVLKFGIRQDVHFAPQPKTYISKERGF